MSTERLDVLLVVWSDRKRQSHALCELVEHRRVVINADKRRLSLPKERIEFLDEPLDLVPSLSFDPGDCTCSRDDSIRGVGQQFDHSVDPVVRRPVDDPVRRLGAWLVSCLDGIGAWLV
jgi:hypothetical protein